MMFDSKNIILDYENSLKSPNIEKVAPYYFRGDKKTAQKRAIIVVKYAIEYILYYTPQEAVALLNNEILDKLKLSPIINKYIDFPAGLEGDRKIEYLVHLCYPRQIAFSLKDWAIEVYKNVLNSTGKKGVKKMPFPKDFFNGEYGVNCACVCLQHMIMSKLNVSSVSELYDLFSDTPKINAILKENSLAAACKNLYNNDPISYLHYSLVDEQKDWFLYNYYEFQKIYSTLC